MDEIERLAPLGSMDAAETAALIADLHKRLERDGQGFAKALASHMPASLPRDLTPENSRDLSAIARLLAHHEPPLPDVSSLPQPSCAHWLRAHLAVGSAKLAELDDAALLLALGDMPLGELAHPNETLERCLAATDARLARLGVSRSEQALEHLRITLPQCARLVASGLAHSDESVRRLALEVAARPGLRARHEPSTALVALARSAKRHEAREALNVLAKRAERDALQGFALRDEAETSLRLLAIDALGRCGTFDDLTKLVDRFVDQQDFEPAIASMVSQMHTRGVFATADELPALLRIFDHIGWAGEDFARVTYTCRDALLTILASLPPDDVRWQRRASILAASEAVGSARLLAERLAATTLDENVNALLEAAAACPDFEGEEAVLPHLRAAPDAALAALEMHGSTKSAAALTNALRDPLAFGTLRSRAIALAFALSEDTRALIELLDVRELPSDCRD